MSSISVGITLENRTVRSYVQPSALAGCLMWFDASDSSTLWDAVTGGNTPADGAEVKRWDNKGTADYALSHDVSGQQPVRKTGIKNNRDVLRFDGAGWLQTFRSGVAANFTDISGDIETTVFVVFKTTNTSSGNLFGWGSAGTTGNAFGVYNIGSNFVNFVGGVNQQGTVPTVSTWYSYSIVKSPGAVNATTSWFRNGVSIKSGTPSSATPNVLSAYPLAVGKWATFAGGLMTGDIAEIIIYNSALSAANRQQVEAYLANKWRI